MKVLHLHKDFLPPTQQWAYLLMKHLPNVENHIAAQHYLQHNFYDPEFRFVENHLDSIIRFNNQLDKRKPEALLQKVLIKALPFFLGNPIQRVVDYLKQEQIELIHAHFAPVAWHFRRLTHVGIPFVVSFYGYDYEQLPFLYPVFQKRYQWLFHQAVALVCEGPHGARKLEEMGCPPDKIQVLPLGIEVRKSPFVKRIKEPGRLNLVQVASFAAKKGQLDTLRAFALAQKSCPQLHLTLVGGEREPQVKRAVEAFMKEHQLETFVSIIDHIEYAELPAFFKKYHVFIHPSQYTPDRDCEGGAPVILMDAMASGLPVIATTHCDIPFVVKQAASGFLVPEKDIKALVRYITKFYEMDQRTYSQMSQAARESVEQKFDIVSNAGQWSRFYHEIAGI